MFVLSPRMLRDLHPACPPTWARLGTLIVLSAFTIALLGMKLTVPDTILVISAVSVTAIMTSRFATGRGAISAWFGSAARAALAAAVAAGAQR